MREEHIWFQDPEGYRIFTYVWHPEPATPLLGAVQIAHGMAETAERYKGFADALTSAGFVVYANDHRGHGKTAGSVANLGRIGEDGFEWMVRNMKQLNEIIRERHPNIPIFLFGHSMGSFLSQRYMGLYGDTIQGVILSGSNGKQPLSLYGGIYLARLEMRKNGPNALSPQLSKLTFGSFNKAFKPTRTEFDWLSRDPEAVDRYIQDPYCGSVFPASFFYYFFKGLLSIQQPTFLRTLPKSLPVYIVSGDKDPVGKFGKGVLELYERFRSLGFSDLSYKLYKDARHELLNETNREEVFNDLLVWLHNHV